jgi:DNA-binding Xre family transcriptional regulator
MDRSREKGYDQVYWDGRKNGKAKAIRLSTLEAICKALDCQPGDLLEYKKN